MRIQTRLVLLFGGLALLATGLLSLISLNQIEAVSIGNYRAAQAALKGNLERQIQSRAEELGHLALSRLKDRTGAIPGPGLLKDLLSRGGDGYRGFYSGLDRSDGFLVVAPESFAARTGWADWPQVSPELWEAVQASLKGTPARTYFLWEVSGELREMYFVAAPVPGTELVAFAVADAIRDFGPLWSVQGTIRAQMERTKWYLLLLAAALSLGMVLVSLLVARWLAGPIHRLISQARSIGQGRLSARLELNRKDELGELARSFNLMSADLEEYIENLRAVTAEKERMGAELLFAQKIQRSILPRAFPVPEGAAGFEVFASLTPAQEVAGDFYDYLPLEGDRVALIIGDVVGKGAAAALLMAMTRAMVRMLARAGSGPAQVLGEANRLLEEELAPNIFVTLLYAEYDLGTGALKMASAGHPWPVIVSGSDVRTWTDPAGLPLGIIPEEEYQTRRAVLAPGDLAFVFTDGLSETRSPEGAWFGLRGILDFLEAHGESGPEDLCRRLRRKIVEFHGGGSLADDLTMMALRVGSLTPQESERRRKA